MHTSMPAYPPYRAGVIGHSAVYMTDTNNTALRIVLRNVGTTSSAAPPTALRRPEWNLHTISCLNGAVRCFQGNENNGLNKEDTHKGCSPSFWLQTQLQIKAGLTLSNQSFVRILTTLDIQYVSSYSWQYQRCHWRSCQLINTRMHLKWSHRS